jgi:thioredoxin reductase
VGKDILPSQVNTVASQNVIEGPYAFVDIEEQKNKTIVIVGAGDNAFENAAMLLQQDCKVFVIARSTPRAQRKFVEKVQGHPKATIIENATLYSAEKSKQGSDSVETMDVGIRYHPWSENGVHQHHYDISSVDRIHVLAGYQANTDSVAPLIFSGLSEFLTCDDNQFLQVDGFGRTNISGIYAAGDVCNIDFPCVVSAVSAGALAAKAISQDLLG